MSSNSFNEVKFIKTLVTLYDEGIDRIDIALTLNVKGKTDDVPASMETPKLCKFYKDVLDNTAVWTALEDKGEFNFKYLTFFLYLFYAL